MKQPTSKHRIAFLHLEPHPGDLKYNRGMIEKAILKAADEGAGWVITPETCVSGYFFNEVIGTDWIEPQPDAWMKHLLETAEQRRLNIFLSHPERENKNGKLFNSLFVLGADGRIKGVHRKIEVHPGPEEDWSTPGRKLEPVNVDGIKAGLLICADILYSNNVAVLRDKGVQLLICSMAWGQKYGPGDLWEKRAAEAGIPVMVCNRTGREKMVDWTKGDSIVAKNGKRLLVKAVEKSAILLFDWDMDSMSPLSREFSVLYLDGD